MRTIFYAVGASILLAWIVATPLEAGENEQVRAGRIAFKILMSGVIVGVVRYLGRRPQRPTGLTWDGVRFLNQGRYVQALELFEQYRRSRPIDPVGSFYAGAARLQLWRLDEARVDLERTKQVGGQASPHLAELLPEFLSILYALLGRAEDARRVMAESPIATRDPGRVALVQAILLAREREWQRARQELARMEVKQLSGSLGALSRTLDAFCVERLTGELRHVDRIALYGEAGADQLRLYWPEFVDFVDRAPPV